MLKVIPIGGWDFGVEPTAMMKVSSHGFSGSDRKEFLQKRAGESIFADLVNKIAIGPGDVPIHSIAIGATEAYGANRNADAFCEDTCIKRAHTFNARPLREYGAGGPKKTDGARYYMNHKNDDPQRSYGYIKASSYNKRMRRIELLMIGNGTKEAANRNGGLVMPDAVKEALENGDYRGGSMSCVLPFDKCAICGNEAPSRKEYCTKEACVGPDGVQGFGCKDGLGRLLKSGRMQFVENPGCTYFDFSDVDPRPADRTAYGGLASEFLNKSAEWSSVRGGAELAEYYGMFSDGLVLTTPGNEYHHRQLKLARHLAELEPLLDIASLSEKQYSKDEYTKMAFHEKARPPLNLLPLGTPGTQKFASGIRALAEAEVMLTPEEFLAIVAPTGISNGSLKKIASEVRLYLPNIFTKLAYSESLPDRLNHAFSVNVSCIPTHDQRSFASHAAKTASYCVCQLSKRASLAVIRGATLSRMKPIANIIKEASKDAEKLAEEYALYQLSTLAAREEEPSPLTLRTVLVHNRC
jgi:hypothetical protein